MHYIALRMVNSEFCLYILNDYMENRIIEEIVINYLRCMFLTCILRVTNTQRRCIILAARRRWHYPPTHFHFGNFDIFR